MPIILDHQLREKIPHEGTVFPVSYFHDELAGLSTRTSPLHWHPYFEIATAESGTLDFQTAGQHVILDAGDSIFVNKNVLHCIEQLSGEVPDGMPNIVFSGFVIAPETGVIYAKYIQPIANCGALPYIVFRHESAWHGEVNHSIKAVYHLMREQPGCYEMAVQRELSKVFEHIFLHFDDLPKFEIARIHINSQIRLQKMLSYIYEHFSEPVTLEDIAGAANVSRSEAGRCFNAYMGCSPVDALIQYRIQVARRLLNDATLTLKEVSRSCGFNSVNYFIRRFKQAYGYTPGQLNGLGK